MVTVYWIYSKFTGSKPWPDYGGRITQVGSVDEWDALVGECAQNDRVLVVDGYALWCGPCKSCAPHYAKLSEALSADSCTFAKFNVDEAGDVAKKLDVSSMPQFMIFKGGKEVERLKGFPGSERLKEVLMKYGAREEEEEEEEEDDDDDDQIEDITEEVEKDKDAASRDTLRRRRVSGAAMVLLRRWRTASLCGVRRARAQRPAAWISHLAPDRNKSRIRDQLPACWIRQRVIRPATGEEGMYRLGDRTAASLARGAAAAGGGAGAAAGGGAGRRPRLAPRRRPRSDYSDYKRGIVLHYS